jgi:two-component system alkaline phosphatase synthesis response regulator PhoP
LGGVSLDDASRTVAAGGNNVDLTYKEYELLKLLLSHPGLVYSRQQILEKIWGIDFKMDTRTVDMHVKTLRQKLGEHGAIIQTVRNVGYKAQ